MATIIAPVGPRYNNADGIFKISKVTKTEVRTPYPSNKLLGYTIKIELENPSAYNQNWNGFPLIIRDRETGKEVPNTSSKTSVSFARASDVVSYDGVYKVIGVSNNRISLEVPSAVNPNWNNPINREFVFARMAVSGFRYVGYFTLTDPDTIGMICNFVAPQGLFLDNGETQYRQDVYVRVEATPVTATGAVRGATEIYDTLVIGSAQLKSQRGATINIKFKTTGQYRLRAIRLTNTNLSFEGTVMDEIRWKDLYAVYPMGVPHFGNVTTVYAKTYATSGALAVKERKLNLLVTRKLPRRVSGSEFTTALYPTNKAEDIISFMCLDKHIGNRTPEEVDFDNIYDTMKDVVSYFGTPLAGEFCYTFDSDNLSFEETIQSVASSVFCTAYRRGSVLKLDFEKKTNMSKMLFNHRNKIPLSEKRTVRFGMLNDYDGVEFKYVSPDDDAIVTYYIPSDRSAINPKSVESIGIRNKVQAHFHVNREWNKIKYQNTNVEFEATDEAKLLIPTNRILVANNIKASTQDGDVLNVEGNVLELSQNVDLKDNTDYTMFVQYADGVTGSIQIRKTDSPDKVVMLEAPRLPLITDAEMYVRTTYIITESKDDETMAFILSERDTNDDTQSLSMKAYNYDDRYYKADTDFIKGLI